jgi:Ca2+-binding EF-hand superfamily protein
MLPCDDLYLRSSATQRKNYPCGPRDYLPRQVERDLTDLLDRELRWHQKIEARKHQLQARYDWSASGSFNAVDDLRLGHIESRHVDSFLRKNGHNALESELIAIIRRLDVDADQKITFSEWSDAMRPVNPPSGGASLAPPSSSSSMAASHSGTSPLRRGEEESKGYSHASPSRGGTGYSGSSPSRGGTSSSYAAASYSSPARGGGSAAKQRSSPLRQDDEEELIRAFKEQISLEKELEEAKIRLASNSDFNLMDAFQQVDKQGRGGVSGAELVDNLSDLGMYANRDDMYLFIRRYDTNSDGKMTYSEFCNAFTPKSGHHSSLLNGRRAHYMHQSGLDRRDFFLRDTRDLFLKTWRVHLNVENTAEMLRKRLGRRPRFSAYDAFAAVDSDNNGYLTRDEFGDILKEYGFYATSEEISWLIDRYDKNRDGRISYSEFIDEILPKSPSRR